MQIKTKTEIPTTSGTTSPAAMAVLLLGRTSEWFDGFVGFGAGLSVAFVGCRQFC
jgi:hypothetical protein